MRRQDEPEGSKLAERPSGAKECEEEEVSEIAVPVLVLKAVLPVVSDSPASPFLEERFESRPLLPSAKRFKKPTIGSLESPTEKSGRLGKGKGAEGKKSEEGLL